MVLSMNNFQFNGEHFLQISGTAMGTKTAVAYANTSMSDFEDKHVYTYHIQPLVWKRFIDDIFMIWTCTKEELDAFILHLNSCHPTIKFTAEISQNETIFLDTKVKKDGESLVTDLYCKPTDSHSYLLYNSAHPQKCKD